MSHQSRREGRPSVKRDADQIRAAIARHFRLLSKSAQAYDEGDNDQVVAMAGLLRGLLQDRLIDHVTSLDQLQFADTADRLPDGAITGYGYGITRVLLVDLGEEHEGEHRIIGRIVAPLGGAYKEEPVPTAPFSTWWTEDQVVYPTSLEFLTRKYVVYEMANTDALHIDTEMDADYDALTRDTHGLEVNGSPITGDLASAAVRQITWETQYTMHHAMPDICGPDFPSTSAASLGGTLVRVAAYDDGSGVPAESGTEFPVQGLLDPAGRQVFANWSHQG
jgi:hypothetical protein